MNQEKIGKFIAGLRKERNLLQKDLAERLGVDNRTISRWETGRCMPDLSLFPVLSKELGVTINDLMSGEIVDKKEYQEKFEENVLKSIEVTQNKKGIIRYLLIGFISLTIVFIIGYILFNNIHFPIHYDEDKMYIEDSEYGLRFANKNLCTIFNGHIKKTITSVKINDEKIGIIFLSSSCSILDHINYYKQGPTSYRWSYIEIPESYFPDKYKIYYTKDNIKKVDKLSEKELLEFIEDANLMYEN